MALSLPAFPVLSLNQQVLLVQGRGTFLASHRLGPQVVALYVLDPFFCEVYDEQQGPRVLRTRSLPVSARLDAYTDRIVLPHLFGLEP